MTQASEVIAQQYAAAGINKITWGSIGVNVKEFGAVGDGVTDDTTAFNRAMNSITGEGTILLPPGTYRIASSMTIPSTICTYFTNGGMIAPGSGATVTINGEIIAELTQIFTGLGTVSGSMKVPLFYPQWWGAKVDGTTNDRPSIQAAIDAASASGGGIVQLTAGTSAVGSAINLKIGVSLRGVGANNPFLEIRETTISCLKWSGLSGGSLVRTEDRWSNSIKDLALDGSFTAGNCLHIVSAMGGFFENLNVFHAHPTSGTCILLDGLSGTMVCGLNTFIRCIADNGAIALGMTGDPSRPVTLNTFTGCRFAGSVISIRVQQHADTNVWMGGRVEAPNGGIGILLSESDNLLVASNYFYGVPIDGAGPTATAIFARAHPSENFLYNCPISGTLGAKYNFGAGSKVKLVDCLNAGTDGFTWGNVSSITVAGSPYTYTNSEPYMEDIVVSGGTVSDIAMIRNGITTSLGQTHGNFRLQPGDGVKVTYTVAPVMNKIPQ